ncbi:MAG TPA: hypothetical protein VMA35_08680 [Candidatus Sulfopaludibacter sp.]|nr:hypothetical protein [Candidatus Sulfopaludibacter sp.]
MNSWLLLNSGKCAPAFNMALDEALLEAMPRLQKPVLRFYGWTEPAATFGYFQKYAEVERITPLRPLIRRPTGGGIVPHDADWTYSLAFPPAHEWHSLKAEESYRRVHEWIQSAFAGLDIITSLAPSGHHVSPPAVCFVGHVKFDLLWQGKKIAGAAQRRNRLGLLIQGSVQPPVPLARTAWQQAICDAAQAAFGAKWYDFVPDGLLHERAETLVRQKYSQPEFITGR